MVLRSIEVTIEKDGTVHLHQKVRLPGSRRGILTIRDEPALAAETALLSEPALTEDWDRPEEDSAWAYFQPDKQSLY